MQTVAEHDAEASAAEFRIGAIRGASTAEIQKLLARFAERRIQEGLRVAGVIEEPEGGVDCGICNSLVLRDTAGSTIIPITQNLGPGSSACKLDSAGLAAGCQAVVAAVERGADVVVLSKYGKVEAEGGGLLDAFRAAAEAGLPVITGVKPSFAEYFLDYAGGFSQWIEASEAELERWWVSYGKR
jgi:glycosyltransferase involved in cell wall biosynthesis